MASEDPEDSRMRAMRRSLLLARIGLVAWALVIVAAVVLALLLRPPWPWLLLTAFATVRLLLDARRTRAVTSLLADELV